MYIDQESMEFGLKDFKLVVAVHFEKQNSSIVKCRHKETTRIGSEKAVLEEAHGIEIKIRCRGLGNSLETTIGTKASLVKTERTVEGDACLTELEIMYRRFIAAFHMTFPRNETKGLITNVVGPSGQANTEVCGSRSTGRHSRSPVVAPPFERKIRRFHNIVIASRCYSHHYLSFFASSTG